MWFRRSSKRTSIYTFITIIVLSFIVSPFMATPTANAAGISLSGAIKATTQAPDGKTKYGPSIVVLKNITDPSVPNVPVRTTSQINDTSALSLLFTFTGLTNSDEYQVCIYNTTLCSATISKNGTPGNFDNVKSSYINVYINVDNANLDKITSAPISASSPTSNVSCAIDGIGWIVCPVIRFMSLIVDGAYATVSTLLTTPSINTNTTDSANGTYIAWQIMRTVANVAFVIAFLFIIFSQLTSVGITNYGVKKMLPRLIIAAILVNISYFVCAIAVDASNILGSSMKQVFDSINAQIAIPGQENASESGLWFGIVELLFAGGTLLYVGLSVLLPALVAALFAIITVFLVLTLRQALIILLIVISPLAFVAFLLPNTENLFKKWRELLTTLLLMFPIISIIFGVSSIASKIIMASDAGWAAKTMGALMSIIPLALTPIIMKAGGGVLNRFGGLINNPNRGPFDRLRKGAEDIRKREVNRMDNAAMNAAQPNRWYKQITPSSIRRRSLQRTARTEAIDQNQQRELARTRTGYIADATAANTQTATQRAIASMTGGRFGGRGLQTQMAAGGGPGALNRAITSAESTRSKLEDSEIADAEALFRGQNSPDSLVSNAGAELQNAIKSGDTIKASAMQKILLSTGGKGISQLHNALKTAESATTPDGVRTANLETMTSLKRNISNAGLKGKNAVLDNWSRSTQSLEDVAKTESVYAGLSAVELAGQDINVLQVAHSNNLIKASQASDVINNKNVFQNLDEAHKAKFREIAPQAPPTPPQPSPILDQNGNPIIR